MNIIEKVYKLIGTLKKRTRTNRIILHHAAAIKCTVDQVDSWHKARGWTCIGYHFFVRKDGTIYRGRPEDTIGAHASNNNSDSIGICAEGNFEVETMPEAQKRALKELVSYLKKKYNITVVQRHRDIGQTDCPGKNYPFKEIAEGINTTQYSAGDIVETKFQVRVIEDADNEHYKVESNGYIFELHKSMVKNINKDRIGNVIERGTIFGLINNDTYGIEILDRQFNIKEQYISKKL